MLKISRALFYIEGRLSDPDLRLEDAAKAAGVSKFHLSRLFAAWLGQTAEGYLRARRLSEAAKSLASGAPDILTVALDSGYSSHEAFTRAFRDHFNITPGECRAVGDLAALVLTEPAAPAVEGTVTLPSPRMAVAPRRLVAGIGARYAEDGAGGHGGILRQWRELTPFFGNLPKAIGEVGYGVNHAFDQDGAFSYLAGIEISDTFGLPRELQTLQLEEQRCAVFTHLGHVSQIPATMRAIWEVWAPGEAIASIGCPCVEVYGARFDGERGEGEIEVWIPIETRRGL